MTAAKYDFVLEEGAEFRRVLTWKVDDVAVNVTGYTAKMQIRTKPGGDLILEALSTGVSPRITLGGSAGTITIVIPGSATTGLEFATGVYDLELTTGTTVRRLLKGNVIYSREVSE